MVVDQERNGEVLFWRVAHDVKSAHESIDWLNVFGDKLPVLFEQIESHDAWNVLPALTDGQFGFRAILTEPSMGIVVGSEVESGWLDETLGTQVGGEHFLDDQPGRVGYCCFRPPDA
jgi:hypothetical protein